MLGEQVRAQARLVIGRYPHMEPRGVRPGDRDPVSAERLKKDVSSSVIGACGIPEGVERVLARHEGEDEFLHGPRNPARRDEQRSVQAVGGHRISRQGREPQIRTVTLGQRPDAGPPGRDAGQCPQRCTGQIREVVVLDDQQVRMLGDDGVQRRMALRCRPDPCGVLRACGDDDGLRACSDRLTERFRGDPLIVERDGGLPHAEKIHEEMRVRVSRILHCDGIALGEGRSQESSDRFHGSVGEDDVLGGHIISGESLSEELFQFGQPSCAVRAGRKGHGRVMERRQEGVIGMTAGQVH